MAEKLVSTGEAARSLGISARSLARWAQEGLITPSLTTAGGHYRFDVEDLRAQLLKLAKSRSEGQIERGDAE
jgi:excisionase family DNA binding protein